MVCAWMNRMCDPQNLHRQEVTSRAALRRAPLSRSLWAAEWVLMNHRQCHKQRGSSSGSLQSVLCVPVTRHKQGVRKEQPCVFFIFKWGFRGIANTIQENKTKLSRKPTYMATKLCSNSLACCVLTDTHTLQVRNFRKKKKILFLWSHMNSTADPRSTLLHLTAYI